MKEDGLHVGGKGQVKYSSECVRSGPDTVQCAEDIGSAAALCISLASSRLIPECHTAKVKYKPREIAQFVSRNHSLHSVWISVLSLSMRRSKTPFVFFFFFLEEANAPALSYAEVVFYTGQPQEPRQTQCSFQPRLI